MPCIDLRTEDPQGTIIEYERTMIDLQKRNDKLAKMLCHVLRGKPLTSEIEEWKKEHQQLDKTRVTTEGVQKLQEQGATGEEILEYLNKRASSDGIYEEYSMVVCDYCQSEVLENYIVEVAICTGCGTVEGPTTEMTEEEYEELL